MMAAHLCVGLPEGLTHRKNLLCVASLLLLFHLATMTPDTILFPSKKKSFMAMQDICCCVSFLPVAASGGYSLVMAYGLLIVVASLVAEHRV